jgi:hypothetical protein
MRGHCAARRVEGVYVLLVAEFVHNLSFSKKRKYFETIEKAVAILVVKKYNVRKRKQSK